MKSAKLLGASGGRLGRAVALGLAGLGLLAVGAQTAAASTAYVVTYVGGVTPLDTVTNTLGTPIAVGTVPWAIAITPNGKLAYVANYDSGTVTPIDTSADTPGTPIGTGYGPDAVAITRTARPPTSPTTTPPQ